MRPVLIVVAAVLSFGGAATALDVTQCQPIPDGQVGVLQADIQCPGPAFNICNPISSVRLCASDADCPPGSQCINEASGSFFVGANATLQFNGHRILNGGIACFVEPCTIQGPGELPGNGVGVGIAGSTLSVHDLDVHGYTDGIYAVTRLELSNVTSHDNLEQGVRVDGRLRASNVTLNNNGGSGAFVVQKITGDQVTANNNGGAGIFADRFHLTNLVATGNGQGGIVSFGRRGRLRDSMITANHLGAAANPVYGDPFPFPPPVTGDFDVITTKRPSFIGSSCDHSLDFDVQTGAPLGPWHICDDE
jgi:hypothetical protein